MDNAFETSKGVEGYTKLPNGLIINWKRNGSWSGSGTTWTFAKPFTTTNYCVAGLSQIAAGNYAVGLGYRDNRTTTSITLHGWKVNGTVTVGANVIAIGY